MKCFIILILAAASVGCGMVPFTYNPGSRGQLASARIMQPNWAGQSVEVQEYNKAASHLSAKACKPVGFRGFEIQHMEKKAPTASHMVVNFESMGVYLLSTNCFGMPLAQVFADLDGDGRYDSVSYKAAPIGQALWVPIDQPGAQIVVVGLSCDYQGRCRKVWEKRARRGNGPVDSVDQYY
ncbi:hypothetical protein KJ611_03200 [Patescibacteria group bacterium]|nr:hypothetical protein [Patescibacteria group bacterium]MBU1705503.1 hypothetical protein [Patescibacteria group bacterium]